METFEAIYGRRSIRDFEPGVKIPDEVVQRILTSAAYGLRAPGNAPLWKMLVVRDEETRNLLADSAQEVAMTLFGASFEVFGPGHLWYLEPETRLRVAEYTATGELWTYPRTADICFVPCLSKGAWMDTVTAFTDDLPLIAQFLGFATQNMWLVGHKYGIGAAYNGMPMLDGRRREVATRSGSRVRSRTRITSLSRWAVCFGWWSGRARGRRRWSSNCSSRQRS